MSVLTNSPSPMLGMGEGARRADEGRVAQQRGCGKPVDAYRLAPLGGPHPALRATFSRMREKELDGKETK
jgi:hypothetical protein